MINPRSSFMANLPLEAIQVKLLDATPRNNV